MIDPRFAAYTEHILEGFAEYCGLELQELSQEKCIVSVRLRPEHMNLYGFVHGGMIDTLMDNTGGILAAFIHGEYRTVVTGCSDAFFLNPIRGERMYAVATPVKAGRTMTRTQLSVYDGDDRLCTVGYLEYVYTDHR